LRRKKKLRRSVAGMIAVVWIATGVAVLAAARLRPPTAATISLSVKQMSFRTDAPHILDQINEDELIVSGLQSLRIHFETPQAVAAAGAPVRATTMEIQGELGASCSFYHVRSGRLDFAGPSIVTVGAAARGNSNSFFLKTHGAVSANLTSQPAKSGSRPGFTCTRTRVNGGPAGEVVGNLSPQGGDSMSFTTFPDARLDFVPSAGAEIGYTQVPILGEIQFSYIDPRSAEEKTVLLPPPAGQKNEIKFEKLDKSVTLDNADLLRVVPDNELYLRRFVIDNGIHLNLHGVVRDIRVGAGVNDMTTHMPSYFDHLDGQKRFFTAVPALVALLLGILDRMRGLPET